MTENQLQLEWGLQPPKNAVAAWGARAILKDGFVDLLWDRQDCKSCDEATKAKLVEALNSGVLKRMHECVAERHKQGRIDPTSQCKHLLVQDGADDTGEHSIFVEADTRGSHGYLYIVAYLTEIRQQNCA